MRGRTLVALCACVTAGCTALIGVRDIHLDDDAGDAGGAEGGSGDGSVTTDGASEDAGSCGADLRTDRKNCGRCGRDCLGGECKDGMCEPITLASRLGNPSGIFVTASNVYVTLGGDGKVIELGKEPGGPVRELATGQTEPWGVWVDGATLYWADVDLAFDGASYHGAIWKCALPACADTKIAAVANRAWNPVVKSGTLYFAEGAGGGNAIKRGLPDAGSVTIDTSSSKPFHLAIDDTHVYATSSEPELWRFSLADGGSEAFGPQAIYATGGVVLDGERVYYTYSESEFSDAGHVLSLLKSNGAAPPIRYGPGNTVPRGIAIDDTHVYWTNWGTVQPGNVSNRDGDVRACPKTGCPATGPIVLAKGLARPYQIAVDDGAVYFNVFVDPGAKTGSVQKVAKP